MPDVAFVRVKMGGAPEEDLAYTMINNKSYTSVSTMFEKESITDRRDFEEDTQTEYLMLFDPGHNLDERILTEQFGV